MSLTLGDALSHYRSVADATHKFWGYFQAVAVGAAGFAWTREGPDVALFLFLSIAFAVFAAANGCLVVSSQSEAHRAAQCIKQFAVRPEIAVPTELQPIISGLKPYTAPLVGLFHAVLSVATLAAIWLRFHQVLDFDFPALCGACY